MPYNNTPIAPTKDVTGTVSLPLARVKKIIATDDEISNCSNNAAFVITVAAEMFVQHLVEQSYNIVKSDHRQKPRRNIQYRDVANAVARVENLEFLSDVVPKQMSYRSYKQKQANNAAALLRDTAATTQQHLQANGLADQRTIPAQLAIVPSVAEGREQATNGASHDPEPMDVDDETIDVTEDGSMHTANDEIEEIVMEKSGEE